MTHQTLSLEKYWKLFPATLRENNSTPFRIKWTNEPVKSLGVCYSYDQKLLHEKNFIWSARGLSLYEKITVIKSLIIPNFVYIASLLTTPIGMTANTFSHLIVLYFTL